MTRKLEGKLSGDAATTWSGPISTRLLSPRMRALLMKLGLPAASFAPAVDGKGQPWHEIVSQSTDLPWVPVKKNLGVKIGAQKCPKCSFSNFGFVHVEHKDIRRFVAETSIPVCGEVHIFGGEEPDVVLSSAGREAVRGRKELRGFVWGRVGSAKAGEIEPKLKFETFPKP